MGSSGGGTQVVKAEETVTPAVARMISSDVQNAASRQNEQRSRLRGIRSTYARFAGTSGDTAGVTGSATKLG
nr:MAG TPA: hypothetical protein [Caudoviricetes sp.]